MLRALFLTRQKFGGAASLARSLVPGLESNGIEAVIDVADDWIPEKTGWAVDRKVSRQVRDAGKGFDFILAWGYRCAWACSEAFYLKKPWGYVAYDTPKTTHDQLIGRLGAARIGICCSRAGKRILDDADAVNLEVIVPGVAVPAGLPSKEVARDMLGVDQNARLVVGVGRAVTDSAIDVFDEISGQLAEEVPRLAARFQILGGNRKLATAEPVDPGFDTWTLIQAADLVFCPDRRSGFKMAAAMGMALGKSVVLRELSSLREIGVPEISLEFFDGDDDAYYRIIDLLATPQSMEAIGNAARARAEDYLSLERCVGQFAHAIKESVGRR
ncbi:MAG: hypothetical protein JNM28_04210 [Armatimonadetes bacterium]|nr:hypothetical protein [Armatimonadota bacterium]